LLKLSPALNGKVLSPKYENAKVNVIKKRYKQTLF
jgi:hypothetical protein